ncbi:hypothetical protein EB796_003514 [Bugula neritina]|uniref:G-protein coupled receptors family 2 profile 2 domain-containing protein n=1 Tax=Bugula neritina TaxID=10212 RepID=A0A7J7KIX7_BUGNE|nr:hypothetical protein EB796_003514 [Bugula neritina]
MNLIVALGLAQLIFIAGIETTYDRVACAAVAALLHYFFTATFTWMLCEGIQLYVKIITVFNSNSRFKQPFYYIIGWVTPLVIVSISMAVKLDSYGSQSSCWLAYDGGLIWAFIGPVCLVIAINMCIMLGVVRIIVTSAASMPVNEESNSSLSVVKAGVKGIFILTPILGANWLFGLFAVNKNTVVFEFLFNIINSLQGLFIFLFHCIGSSEVRSAFRSKLYMSSKSRYNISSSKPGIMSSADYTAARRRSLRNYTPSSSRKESSEEAAFLNEVLPHDLELKDKFVMPNSAISKTNRRYGSPKKQASTITVVTCLEFGKDDVLTG